MILHLAERAKEAARACSARRTGPDLAPAPTRNARLCHRQRSGHDGQSGFKLCLRELGWVRPLTPEAGIALAARIKEGDKQARELLIKSSLPQVVKVAREYEDRGLPLLDLVSEGNLGRLKAVERFDSAEGAKFPTCIPWWVRQSIGRALAKQPKTSGARTTTKRRSGPKLPQAFHREWRPSGQRANQ